MLCGRAIAPWCCCVGRRVAGSYGAHHQVGVDLALAIEIVFVGAGLWRLPGRLLRRIRKLCWGLLAHDATLVSKISCSVRNGARVHSQMELEHGTRDPDQTRRGRHSGHLHPADQLGRVAAVGREQAAVAQFAGEHWLQGVVQEGAALVRGQERRCGGSENNTAPARSTLGRRLPSGVTASGCTNERWLAVVARGPNEPPRHNGRGVVAGHRDAELSGVDLLPALQGLGHERMVEAHQVDALTLAGQFAGDGVPRRRLAVAGADGEGAVVEPKGWMRSP